MRNFSLAALALLSGCFNPAAKVQGVWVLYLDPNADNDTSFECDENFKDAKCFEAEEPTEDPEWTYEDTTETDDKTIMVVEIIGGESTDAFMVVQQTIIPGTIDAGVATFSWPSDVTETTSKEHEEGYQVSHVTKTHSDTTLTLDIGAQTGTISFDSSSVSTWKETDEWDYDDNGIFTGEIPVTSYLEVEDGNSYNASDESECSDDDCEIKITTKNQGQNTFTATKTDYKGMNGVNAIDATSPD